MADHTAPESLQGLDAMIQTRALARREKLLARASGKPAVTPIELVLVVTAIAFLVVDVIDSASGEGKLLTFGILLIIAGLVRSMERRLDAMAQLLRELDGGPDSTRAAA